MNLNFNTKLTATLIDGNTVVLSECNIQDSTAANVKVKIYKDKDLNEHLVTYQLALFFFDFTANKKTVSEIFESVVANINTRIKEDPILFYMCGQKEE